MINGSDASTRFCGQNMTGLEHGDVEASHENHIPVVSVYGNTVTVTVGSVEHHTVAEHSVLWVYLRTDRGGQRKCLKVGRAPALTLALTDERPLSAYAYSNLHSPLRADI